MGQRLGSRAGEREAKEGPPHPAISSGEGMATFTFLLQRRVLPRRPRLEAQQRPHHRRPTPRAMPQRGEGGGREEGRKQGWEKAAGLTASGQRCAGGGGGDIVHCLLWQNREKLE